MSDEHDEEKTVRVAVALSRAVALSEELQATVLELADTLRKSGVASDKPIEPGEIKK